MLDEIKKIIPEVEKNNSLSIYKNAIKQRKKKKLRRLKKLN